MMQKDSFIECPRCKGDACMKIQVSPEVATFHCWGCGFISNTLMKPGEEFFELQMMQLPELHKDLAFVDQEGRVWLPNTINKETKGMVFANGTSADNWRWTAAKAVERSTEELVANRKNKKKYKMDLENAQHFAEKDYMEALSYVGLLPE
jgi:hypothetical protein